MCYKIVLVVCYAVDPRLREVKVRALIWLTVLTIAFCATPVFAQGTVERLDSLGGPYARADEVKNGGLIVGMANGTDFNRPVYWRDGQIYELTFPGMVNNSQIYGASADGSIMVGAVNYGAGNRAVVWINGVGQILSGQTGASAASSVSEDGRVIVGTSAGRAVRWVDGQFDQLSFVTSAAFGVSPNGNVVVGRVLMPSGRHATRWVDGVEEVLGTLGGNESTGEAASHNGNVVVGWSDLANGERHGFRWENDQMIDLGTLGGTASYAFSISADGSIITGLSSATSSSTHRTPFVWTEKEGMVALETLLDRNGIQYDGWVFEYDSAGPFPPGVASSDRRLVVSPDGRTFAGTAEINGDVRVFLIRDFIVMMTPEELAASVANIPKNYAHAQGSVMKTLADPLWVASNALGDYLGTGNLPAASAQTVFVRKSLYATGSIASWREGGDASGGSTGILLGASDRLAVGAGVSGSRTKDDASLGGYGKADARAIHVIGAWEHEQGWRLYGVANAGSLKVTTDRRYMNGSALESSKGKADGSAYGVAARFGYEMSLDDKNSLMPYAEVQWTRTTIDAYDETGGAAPASVGKQKGIYSAAKIGAQLQSQLTKDFTLGTRAAFAHRLSGDDQAGVSVSTMGFRYDLDAATYDRNWFEGGLSAGYRVNHALSVGADLTGRTHKSSEPSVAATLGVVYRFH